MATERLDMYGAHSMVQSMRNLTQEDELKHITSTLSCKKFVASTEMNLDDVVYDQESCTTDAY